jgi:DNA-binding transcriptional MerR regulator
MSDAGALIRGLDPAKSCKTSTRAALRRRSGALTVEMRTLKTSEAAALLNVSPNTLRAWERRFGYPRPQRSIGRHRLYTHGEIAALRDALQDGLSISSAVSAAREALNSESHSLLGALSASELERADVAMESALALRTLERTVEEVLLPSLQEVHRRHGGDSVHWVLAARWASDWLRRAQRISPPPTRPDTIVVGDASGGDFDPDAAFVRALELFCMRAGGQVLSLSVTGVNGLADVLAGRPLAATVVAGNAADDEAVARWAYAVRSAFGPLPLVLYRRPAHSDRLRAPGARALPETPAEAQLALYELAFGSLARSEAPLRAGVHDGKGRASA